LLGAIAGTLSIVSDGLTPLIFEGSVYLDGERLDTRPAHERGIGLVTQDPLLFPHLTVAENLAFAMNRHTPKAERTQQVKDALQAANLPAMGQADPSQLSGGERARIALMRALLAKPRALLLDEPFSKLDDSLRQHIREWFFRQVTQRGIPALLVTHDPADVADHSRVIQLHHA
jgi:putative thiamine transport system ATP-binding protein